MTNKPLAALFERIADLLEIRAEDGFRVNSYRRAARAIKDLPRDAAAMLADGSLADVPGIGKSTLEKITQFTTTGRIALHDELAATVPAGLPALLDVPGLGPKKVALAWKELHVDGLDALRKAIDDGRLAALKGFGEKSVSQIRAGLDFAARSADRTPLGVAWPIGLALLERVRALTGVKRADLAGSLRRGCETVGDLDILCEAPDGDAVIAAFVETPGIQRVLAAGSTKASVVVERPDGPELQVDLRVVPAESYGAALQYFTGSKDHNVRLRELAAKRKWKLNEWGLFDDEERRLAGKDEATLYRKLGLPCFPPELREDAGEFDLPRELPRLVARADIRGDLHMHTTASDGTASAADMVAAARERGYEYVAITDHSQSSAIANGLTVDRMWRQVERVRALNRSLHDITVLVGCECDILADGSLDYPNNLLAACDIVVASVHSALRQDRDKLTQRVIRAMENPYVSIIAHLTGRLINRREPGDFDVDAVIAAAARTHTALEINAAWQRLDLCDRHARLARQAGVMLVIDTDSHAPAQLDQMSLGVTVARRAGATARDILNSRHLPLVRKWIQKKRAHAPH
ncbi:MAG: DNA polymerase/3'-5' exonuclease PolX [Phycisphaerae bacterium]